LITGSALQINSLVSKDESREVGKLLRRRLAGLDSA
jgi:hypothetical protein